MVVPHLLFYLWFASLLLGVIELVEQNLRPRT